jgi:hypothetical protein
MIFIRRKSQFRLVIAVPLPLLLPDPLPVKTETVGILPPVDLFQLLIARNRQAVYNQSCL